MKVYLQPTILIIIPAIYAAYALDPGSVHKGLDKGTGNTPEIKSESIPIPPTFARIVQILDAIMAPANEVVLYNLGSPIGICRLHQRQLDRTMTPAIELRKTEYAERYDVNLLLLLRRFQGNMQKPTMAAM
jgi:hypothetical protein